LRLAIEHRTLRLVRPLETSYGQVQERELLLVSLTDDAGLTGYGEAAPLEPYAGVSVQRVRRALERYGPVLRLFGDASPAEALEACRSVEDLPQALAAIDLALWDRAGRSEGRSVAELLAESPAREVPVNATISALDRAGVAEQAAEASRQGFPCIKLKVGVGDDAGRVAAARAAAGPQMDLRLDANGAWSVDEAVSTIEALAPAGLELVEEPVHGLEATREVRERVAARISIDETAEQPGALVAGVADAVCLKVSRCGGISGLLAAAALVRASGAEVYLASTLDGPIGIAAGVHAAAALAAQAPLAPCGLATLPLFEDTANPVPARRGAITVPKAPGLGVEPG
jgi:L-Ala-D/L-Glu epimerase